MASKTLAFQETKQLIVVNSAERLTTEKMMALVKQASAGAFMAADIELQKMWLKQGRPQVVLRARNEEDFQDFLTKLERRKLFVYQVADLAGKGIACIGVGPCAAAQVEQWTMVFDFYQWVRQNAFKGMLLRGDAFAHSRYPFQGMGTASVGD